MQESLLSLFQMAKTNSMLTLLSKKGLPYISVLTDPTMGGISASFAFMGDVVMADHTLRAWAFLSRVAEPPCDEVASLVDSVGPIEAAERIHRLCRVMERNGVYERVHPVPIYMTRVGMYLDAVFDNTNHVTQREVLYALDGRRTLLEIATANGADFDVVADLVERLHGLGLLRRVDGE